MCQPGSLHNPDRWRCASKFLPLLRVTKIKKPAGMRAFSWDDRLPSVFGGTLPNQLDIGVTIQRLA